MTAHSGIVYLVGAGPGDPQLITIRGRDLLRRADVVVYDRLVARELLALAGAHAERIDAGKAPGRHAMRQDEINQLLVDRARAGKCVVRLKGGDPFVFGRGAEELDACRQAGVPCLVVPGVSSALAAPLSAGIAVTQRGIARSFTVITARTGIGETQTAHNFAALARVDTLVVLMGCAQIATWAQALIAAGKSPNTPVTCIAHATTPHQQIVTATLEDIASAAELAGIESPMVAVVGEVAEHADLCTVRELLPLVGRRVLLTGATDTNRRLANTLSPRGALPVSCPLIRIAYPRNPQPLRAALTDMERFDCIVFTSRHGVIGFFKQLAALRRDARALHRCRIAAIGRGTAEALRRHGVNADLIPRRRTADGIAHALLDEAGGLPKRVLHPRSNIAQPVLARRLRDAGVQVDEPVAYETIEQAPTNEACELQLGEDDAVILCSPSAARAYAKSGLRDANITVATIGEVTANAARDAGLSVQVVAHEPSAAGMVHALEEHLSNAGVAG